MIIENILVKNTKDNVIKIVKTKRFKINYSKQLHTLFIVANLTKHTGLCIRIQPYCLSFDYGYLALGIDFNYRLQKIDHKGFDIILRLLFFEVEIECTDDRHLEDYKDKEQI